MLIVARLAVFLLGCTLCGGHMWAQHVTEAQPNSVVPSTDRPTPDQGAVDANIISTAVLDSGALAQELDPPTAQLIAELRKERPSKSAIKKLLQQGANINYIDERGWSPLIVAIRYSKSSSVFDLLVENGANVTHADRDGNGMYQHAVLAAKTGVGNKIIRKLGKIGLEVESRNAEGLRPIDMLDHPAFVDAVTAAYGSGAVSAVQSSRRAALSEAYMKTNNLEPTTRLRVNWDALVVKPDGSGKGCNYVLVIGNFTNMGLRGQVSVRMSNGKFKPYLDSQGGKFEIPPSAAVQKHAVRLNQGSTAGIAIAAGPGGSWSDMLQFGVPDTCRTGRAGLNALNLIVERDNRTNRISISEDTDGDGRRDVATAAPRSLQGAGHRPGGPANQCAKIQMLATEVTDDKALLYSDEQLASLSETLGCPISQKAADQRTLLKALVAR